MVCSALLSMLASRVLLGSAPHLFVEMARDSEMDPDAQYVEYVRTHLGKAERPTKAERKMAYARAQEELRDHYWEKGYSKAEWTAADEKLQRAITHVEGAFKASLIDRFSDTVRDLWGPSSKTFLAISGVLTSVSDFLKPILDFTGLFAIGSGLALFALLVLIKRRPESRQRYLGTASFCGVLLLCSAGWWGVQKVVPGANANGLIAEIVPGASAAQNALLASLGRIEQQTKRVGDLLEEGVKREREAQEAIEQARSARSNELQARIHEGGYTLDATGYLAAIADEYRYKDDFKEFGIKLTEPAFKNALKNAELKKVYSIMVFLFLARDDYAEVRRLLSQPSNDAKTAREAFKSKNARATVCNPGSYSLVISAQSLTSACKLEGRAFATAYASYFNSAYSRAYLDVDIGFQVLESDYSIRALSELKITTLTEPIRFGNLPLCGYYEGEISFTFHRAMLDIYFERYSDAVLDSVKQESFSFMDREIAVKENLSHMCQRHATSRWTEDDKCQLRVVASRSCSKPVKNQIVKILSIERPTKKIFPLNSDD